MTNNTAPVQLNSPRRRRRLLFRLLAVLLGLSIVLLLEGMLRLTSWGNPQDLGDPFVGFSDVQPLFVLNETGDRFHIPESRHVYFQPESFAARKQPNEFRIFCLGGSTVQGRPYSIETSFTTWLELSLTAADRSRQWEVVNCGGVSYASYRLVPIMREVLAHGPDLFIVYTGHNEFLEERTYGHIKHRPAWIKSAHERLSGFRIYGLARSLCLHFTGDDSDQAENRTTLAADVDALLDYEGALAEYHRDDPWRQGVIEHFEHNLRRMTHIARASGVPMILVNPVSNLKDSPPFKTEQSRDLTPEQIAEFQRLWDQAKETDWSQLARKAKLLKQALAIDDRHADAHFLLAKVYDQMGWVDEAKIEYIRAKDEDVCPLRILEPMHEIIQQVARQTGTPLVDVRQLFENEAQDGIPGDRALIDHVHPRIDGHQLIAGALLDQMVRQQLVTLRADWQTERKRLYAERLGTLDPTYFPHSVERLRGLRRWAAGRATRIRATERPQSSQSQENSR